MQGNRTSYSISRACTCVFVSFSSSDMFIDGGFKPMTKDRINSILRHIDVTDNFSYVVTDVSVSFYKGGDLLCEYIDYNSPIIVED